MFGVTNISDAFEVSGFVEQKKELDKLLMSNPAMEKKVQALVRKALSAARSSLGKYAKGNEAIMKSDPRQAYRAVRMMVYKRILGGNVSILSRRRASGGGGAYTPTRTLRSGQRGGNRRSRSERTYKLESYFGADRGFVLRFLNEGTAGRYVDFNYDEAREHIRKGIRGGNLRKYGKTVNTGYRGKIRARNWFGRRSQWEMERAAENLTHMIDTLIKQEIG